MLFRSATGNAVVNGTLGVDGDTTLSNVVATGNAVVNGTLGVDGAATFGKEADNQTIIDNGTFTHKATDAENSKVSTALIDYAGLNVESTDGRNTSTIDQKANSIATTVKSGDVNATIDQKIDGGKSAISLKTDAKGTITTQVGATTKTEMTDGKVTTSVADAIYTDIQKDSDGKGTIRSQIAADTYMEMKQVEDGTTTITTAATKSIEDKVGGNSVAITTDSITEAVGDGVSRVMDTTSITDKVAGMDGETAVSTEVSQTAKDISLTAAAGAITSDAATITNTATESITDKVGENTSSTMTTDSIALKSTDGTISSDAAKIKNTAPCTRHHPNSLL